MGNHAWGNYFLAAYKGVWEHLAAKGAPPPPPLGLQVMIHGTVPTGARQRQRSCGCALCNVVFGCLRAIPLRRHG